MRLNDAAIEACNFDKIMLHDSFPEVAKQQLMSDLLKSYLLKSYTEGVTLLLGLHPFGRFCKIYDTTFSMTEHGIVAMVEGENAVDVKPEDFLLVYVVVCCSKAEPPRIVDVI